MILLNIVQRSFKRIAIPPYWPLAPHAAMEWHLIAEWVWPYSAITGLSARLPPHRPPHMERRSPCA
jgi:hypothetical protein